MCAIIGASAPFKVQIDMNDIKILYLTAESRGGDACGFTDGKRIIKSAVKSYDFINKDMKSDEFPDEINTFIGHTRYATIGNKSDSNNAHPFAEKYFMGVHNGSIYNHEDLKYASGSDKEVDSAIMYEIIGKHGLKKTLPLLSGLLALSFFDVRNKTVNLYRMPGKPLHYGYKYYGEDRVLFWASLPEYLEAIGCSEITSLQEHTLYKIKRGKIISAKNLPKYLKPTLPNTYITNNIEYYCKASSLDIFSERKELLKQLGYNTERKKESKRKDRTQDTKDKSNTKEVIRYEKLSFEEVPASAFAFDSTDFGKLWYWFDEKRPHIIKLFAIELGFVEEYDLSLDNDKNILSKAYGTDGCDIVMHIMHNYGFVLNSYKFLSENEKETANKQ